jgi:hypothetical protein
MREKAPRQAESLLLRQIGSDFFSGLNLIFLRKLSLSDNFPRHPKAKFQEPVDYS